jgi:hypothetical protein
MSVSEYAQQGMSTAESSVRVTHVRWRAALPLGRACAAAGAWVKNAVHGCWRLCMSSQQDEKLRAVKPALNTWKSTQGSWDEDSTTHYKRVGMDTGTGSGINQSTWTRTRKTRTRTRTRTRGSTGRPRVVRIDRITVAEACREGSTPSKHEIFSSIEVFKCIGCLMNAWEYHWLLVAMSSCLKIA